MLEWLGHGGDWVTFLERYPHVPKILDFSANINPLGPPSSVREQWPRLWSTVGRYPDPRQRRLRSRLAARHGIAVEQVLVTNGGAEAIELLMRALRPQKVGLVEPCFGEYRQAAERVGAQVVARSVPETSEGFVIPFSVVESLLAEVDVLVLGNPNNPTGMLWERSQLEALAQQAARRRCHLMLDEVFLDFLPEEDDLTMIPAAADGSVSVVRSLTKMYAIPGLRLGYLVADEALVARCRKLQTPWSVNGVAEQVGQLVLADEDFVMKTRLWLTEERQWFMAAVEEQLADWFRPVPMPAAVNYMLLQLRLEGWTDVELQRRLAELGIMIRACRTFPGMGESYVRLAIRLREDNERFLATMRQLSLGDI